MPNLFTRVPDTPVPPLPAPMRVCIFLADAFMIAMISRPKTGSLSNTWVTPSSLGLAAGALIGGVASGAFSLVHAAADGSLWWAVAGIASLAFALGAGSLLAVAVAQR